MTYRSYFEKLSRISFDPYLRNIKQKKEHRLPAEVDGTLHYRANSTGWIIAAASVKTRKAAFERNIAKN
jgi:hypothetical protein